MTTIRAEVNITSQATLRGDHAGFVVVPSEWVGQTVFVCLESEATLLSRDPRAKGPDLTTGCLIPAPVEPGR